MTKNLFKHSLFIIASAVVIGGCTTQDFEYAGKIDDVYRIKIENVSEVDITYSHEGTLHYLDGIVKLDSTGGTIAPGSPAELIIETEEGATGLSVDVNIITAGAELKLTLLRGTGTGNNFELDSTVVTKISDFIVAVRYGDIY